MSTLIRLAIFLSIFAIMPTPWVAWIGENITDIHSVVTGVMEPIHNIIIEKFNAFTSGSAGQQV